MYEPPYLLPEIPRDHNKIGPGGFMESSNFVQNNTGWRIDGDGYIYAPYIEVGAIALKDTSGTLQMTGFAATGNLWLSVGQSDSTLLMGSVCLMMRDLMVLPLQLLALPEFHTKGSQRVGIADAGTILTTCAVGTGTNVEINGFAVLVQDTSSIRYKNVADVNMGDYLTPSMIDSLQPKMWSYKNDTSNHPQISLIAEEANGVSPFLITNEFDDDDNVIPAGLSTKGLISLLIIALKDARTRITALES